VVVVIVAVVVVDILSVGWSGGLGRSYRDLGYEFSLDFLK
jgi:hypothetical protein